MADIHNSGKAKHLAELFINAMGKLMNDDLDGDRFKELTPVQLNALKYLDSHKSSSVSGLAKGLGISQPAATMLTDRMLKNGFITREISKDDRRGSVIDLSDRAKEMLAKIDSERVKRFNAIIDIMDEESKKTFTDALEKFIKAALDDYKQKDTYCLKCGDNHDPECVINKTRPI